VSARFKELLDFGFNQLNLNELRPRIKQWCEAYTLVNHKINEVSFFVNNLYFKKAKIYSKNFKDELNQYEAIDPFIQNFIKNIDQMISSIKVFFNLNV
jgi:hypothetical protein